VILLIEDDDTTREVTATLLRYGGHDVHTAMNGRHALALLQTIVPTVIFCDLHMPQLDGWGFRRAQMSSSQLQRIPFVAVSAHLSPLDDHHELQAAMLLHKPVDPDDLLRCARLFDRPVDAW